MRPEYVDRSGTGARLLKLSADALMALMCKTRRSLSNILYPRPVLGTDHRRDQKQKSMKALESVGVCRSSLYTHAGPERAVPGAHSRLRLFLHQGYDIGQVTPSMATGTFLSSES